MNPIFLAKIKKNKVIFNNVELFNKYLIKLEGKDVEVVVRPWRKTRSVRQNKFLWAVPYQLIADATGYSREEVHDAMRLLFLKDENRSIPTLKSTTSLTTVEMNLYWEQMQRFASEKLDLQIPNPNEVEI
jgi:hypothetical protein